MQKKSIPKETKSCNVPVQMVRRIGTTIYNVSIHFSQTSTETVEDKILRLIKSEVKNIA